MRRALITLALLACMASLQAQSTPTFEVVSIRRNTLAETERASLPPGVIPGPVQSGVMPGGRLVAIGITLRELIRDAYGYQRRPPSDISGGPGWLDTERYDINATAQGNFGPAPPGGLLPPAAASMLKAMLTDRFRLKLRSETQERPIYELVMTRPDRALGTRLVPAEGKCLGIYAIGQFDVPRCAFRIGGGQGFDTGNMTMAEFATFLSGFPAVNSTVIDRTGLPGAFDITLRFRGAAQDLAPGGPTSEYPLLFDALQQQLNLKLERSKGPVDVLIVEQAERPTAN